ncbi:type I-B CRISPR-associated protein Cas5b [uncultured Draconibacterium sp.]|uniref:type I-B CRISPR-associated protein Cas5b n=1 Tax=uncultured Draconibacterium sp. TaxID=1573823 RepID=UPI0029C99955|nr:type I-B CRISPR-associated protein Cas5b [uncultured Draconibacterium sp.]
MNSKEILIFDISSEYGHFRKYNTTTSPLTYSIPTRTAIAGFLGAILGMEREVADGVYPDGAIPVQEFFSKANSDIAVQIINPVKKENVAINLINTKKSFYDLTKAGRTQIEFELLKNVRYRIYFGLQNNETTFNELAERIKAKNHHFSPYLGLAQFTATIDFVDVIKTELIENTEKQFIEIATAVNLSKIKEEQPIDFDYSAMYSANNMPIEMNRNREVQEYSEVLIEKNGLPVKAKVENYYRILEYGNILFL